MADVSTTTVIALFGGRIETKGRYGPKRYFVELRRADGDWIIHDTPNLVTAFIEAVLASADFEVPLLNEL